MEAPIPLGPQEDYNAINAGGSHEMNPQGGVPWSIKKSQWIGTLSSMPAMTCKGRRAACTPTFLTTSILMRCKIFYCCPTKIT